MNHGFWGYRGLTKSKEEEMNSNKLNKQVDELTKRVAYLEGVVRNLQQELKNSNMKVKEGPSSTYSKPNNFVNSNSQNVHFSASNNNQSAQVKSLDKTQKPSPINKEMKLVIESSPTITIPTKATTQPAASYSSNRNQLLNQTIVSKTSASIRLEPFAFKSTTSMSKKPITIPAQNGSTVLRDSSVKNAAKRYEELSQTQTNLNRRKSQSASDLFAIPSEKKVTNSALNKNQLTLVPQNKEFLSSSLSTNKNEVIRGTPTAPPLPKSPLISTTNTSSISSGQRSTQAVTSIPKNDTSNKRSDAVAVVSVNENSHDLLMDQLKQFADKGFPFKRQITKQSDTHSNTWSFSKNNTGRR